MTYDWLIDGIEESWREIDRVVQLAGPEGYEKPTACPGWTVRDILSHVLGFELLMQGIAPVPYDASGDPHVKNPIGEFNEAYVAERRSRPGDEVRREFVAVGAASIARLRTMTDEEWETVRPSPLGDHTSVFVFETRLLDTWIHLHDICDALAMPLEDGGAGEEVVVNRFEAALPYVVGRKAALPEGSRARVTLTGRLARLIDIEVVGGRGQVATTPGEPDVEIVTPTAVFWRRAAGRISPEAFLTSRDVHLEGDLALATRIVENVAVLI